MGATAWTAPGNATRDDAANATVSLIALAASQVLTASEFNVLAEDAGTLFGSGIKIPAGASIVGLRFYYEYSLSSGNSPTVTLAGLGHTASGVSQAMAVRSYGWGTLGAGSTVNVGTTWNGNNLTTDAGALAARADLADPDLILTVNGSNGTGLNDAAYAVDHVRIEVEWILKKDGAGTASAFNFGSGVVKAQATAGAIGSGIGAFPTTAVLDNFNRANGGLGANWSDDPLNANPSAFQIDTNVVKSPTYSEAWWNPATYGPGVECFATVAARGANTYGAYVGVLRDPNTASSTADGYQVGLIFGATDKFEVYRYDNAASTLIASADLPAQVVAGDKIGIEVTSTGTVRSHLYRAGAWSQITSTADGTYTFSTGNAVLEMAIFDGTFAARLDDFGGGTVVAASGGAPSTTSFGSGIASAQATLPVPASSASAFGSGIQKPIMSMAGSASSTSFASATGSVIATRDGVGTAYVSALGTVNATMVSDGTAVATALATGSPAATANGDAIAVAYTFAQGGASQSVVQDSAATATAAASGGQSTIATIAGTGAATAIASGIARAYSFAISGFAYDQASVALAGVRVDIYRTSDHFHMGRVTTGPTGYYSLAIPNQPEVFWVRFYLAGPPETFDTTGDNLALVESQVQGPP